MKTALRLLLAPYRFSVDRLFRMGQVGWAHWFDSPSLYPGGNHLYLYQDSAGTTPVTAVGDTIGLSLDRAYGGRTDGSLIASGATGLTGTATAASYNTSTGAGSVSRAGDASNQSWVTWTGLTTSAIHRIRVTNTGATSLDVRNGSVSGTIVASIAAGATSYVHPLTSGGSTSITITATNNSTTATFTLSQFAAVPGTHRIQATSASRPLLMARVNMLTNSDAPTWSLANAGTGTTPVVTNNAGTSPRGTGNAQRLQCNRGGGTASGDYSAVQLSIPGSIVGAQYKSGIYVKSNTGAAQNVMFYINTGASVNAQVVSVGTEWQLFPSAIHTATSTNIGAVTLGTRGGTPGPTTAAGGDDVLDLLIWGADLRTADDAAKNIPVYQRVGATAADHDTAGFPHAAYPDGTDDFDTTSMGGGGTSGFFFCGVLTVSGGAGTARTIWSDTGTNTGYRVRINSSNKLELAAGNGSAYTTVQSNETITAPGTYLLSAWDDGGVLAVQVGNAAAATTARPAVSAGTSTITSYRDNGAATSYFNGRDYGSVYRQSYPGETAHNRLKQWQARRAGITV